MLRRALAGDCEVPRISFFYGIAITMYFYDHEPPNGADLDPLVLHGDFAPAARFVHR